MFSFQSTAATAALDIVKNEDGSCSSFAFKPLASSNLSSDMQSLGNLVIIMQLFASGFSETQFVNAIVRFLFLNKIVFDVFFLLSMPL